MTRTTEAQTIREFFQPLPRHNYVTYLWPKQHGRDTGLSRILSYSEQNDTLLMADVMFFQDPRSGQMASPRSTTSLYRYSGKSVELLFSDMINMLGEHYRQNFTPPQVYLMLPAAGQTTRWKYTDLAQNHWSCQATLTTLTYQGKPRKALRVVRTCQGIEHAKLIDFYLQGLGFYKTVGIDEKGIARPFESLSKLEWDDEVEAQARTARQSTHPGLVVEGEE